jgi:predicted nicotinamide N-methyase
MGSISRQFQIPSPSGSFELAIHEPALTGDDLGLKTWAASYLLAKRLHTINFPPAISSHEPSVLELGSGTGLVGMAMAALGADVVLTDLPSIHPNLSRNLKANIELIEQNHGYARSGILDWTEPTMLQVYSSADEGNAVETTMPVTKFPVILAADSLYASEHPRLLVNTIEAWLADGVDARVVIEFPFRDAYLPEIKDFRNRMSQIGLCIVEEGEESGYDDWGSSGTNTIDEEKALVRCWWALWARSQSDGC